MKMMIEYGVGVILIIGGVVLLGISQEPWSLLLIISGMAIVAISGRNLP